MTVFVISIKGPGLSLNVITITHHNTLPPLWLCVPYVRLLSAILCMKVKSALLHSSEKCEIA